MPLFKVGDQVERIGTLVNAPYVRSGVVIRIMPNKAGLELFTEYEISFDEKTVVTLFETQLRLVRAAQED